MDSSLVVKALARLLPLGPSLLAGTVAYLVTYWELLTSAYPQTNFLIRRCRWAHGHALTYGAAGFIAMFVVNFKAVFASATSSLIKVDLSQPWISAVLAGVFCKAVLHMRLFNLHSGGQLRPIGLESIIQPLDTWILDTLDLEHHNARTKYIASRARMYPNLEEVKEMIVAETAQPPRSVFSSDAERKAYVADVKKSERVTDAMRLYLERFGRTNFERLFQLPDP